jgi:hypothetical protein
MRIKSSIFIVCVFLWCFIKLLPFKFIKNIYHFCLFNTKGITL